MENLKKIFDLYESDYKDSEITSEQLKETLKDTSIILYGAGTSGMGVLYGFRKIGINPLLWLDGNPIKWNTEFQGLRVENPETYKAHEDCLIVVCINTDGKSYCKSFDESLKKGGHSAVYKKLESLGYKKIVDYSQFYRCYEMFDNNPFLVPSVSDVRYTLSHKEDIEKAYSLLSDDLSREVMEKLLTFQIIDRATEIPTNDDAERYFAPDIFKLREDECLVDCGAYDGMYLDRFLKLSNGKIKKYMAIECDSSNFEKLQKKYDDMTDDMKEKTELFSIGLSDKKETKNFYSLNSPGSFFSETGTKAVNCDTMDSILNGREITFIKMNMENSELLALKGAEKLIKTNNPILAISNYHKTKNIWGVILELNRLNPDYKCYMRSYMGHLSLVAYAVPADRLLM